MLSKRFVRLHESAELEYIGGLLRFTEPDRSARFLDLGCGGGDLTQRIATAIGTDQAFGAEMDPQAILKCETKGIKTIRADLNQPLPIANDSFDVVCASHVLEHVHDTDMLVSEIRRVLRPTGYALVATPNLASWHNIFCLFIGWQPFATDMSDKAVVGNPLRRYYGATDPRGSLFGHRRVPTWRGLKELFELHQLRIEGLAGAGFFPLPNILARAAVRIDPRHSLFLVMKLRKS